jgi:hypothetical protein
MIFGADGYIGWPLALRLGESREKKIVLVDNFSTRELVRSVHSDSLVPIPTMHERIAYYKRATGRDNLAFVEADARDPLAVDELISRHSPESIVHLAQQRSAPFSMISQEHALYTQTNNLATNLNIVYSLARHSPKAHLLKMGCYSEDTEILTKTGWKLFKELSYEDEVLTLDPVSEQMRYSHPSEIVSYNYQGRMLRILTQTVDLLITPDHRVAYRTGWRPEIKIQTATERAFKNYQIPKTGIWKQPDIEFFELPSVNIQTTSGQGRQAQVQTFKMDAWLDFFGYFISGGTIRKCQGEPTAVCLSQSKKEHLPALENCIRNLGLSYVKTVYPDKRNPQAEPVTVFEVSNNHLANYLNQYGLSQEKFIPKEIRSLSQRQLRILFSSLMAGGSHTNEKTGSSHYYSKSLRLLGDIQEIALKLGYGATICAHTRKGIHGFRETHYWLCL